MAETKTKKHCFVVSPIGSSGSPQRVHADWLYEGIILPVFGEHYPEYEVTRADKIWLPGSIDSQIIEFLLDAELVIADITTLNPNVFYEIGIRHAARKPVVHFVEENETIPFDLKLFRHVPFSVKTPQSVEAAKLDLKRSVDAVFAAGDAVDNPVTRTRARYEFEKNADPLELRTLVQVDELLSRITKLENELREETANTIVSFTPKFRVKTLSLHEHRAKVEVSAPTEALLSKYRSVIEEIIGELFPRSNLSEYNENNVVYVCAVGAAFSARVDALRAYLQSLEKDLTVSTDYRSLFD